MKTTKPDMQHPEWPKESPFKVPEGYFDELSESILGRIQNNLREELPSSKQALKEENTFQLPPHYFARLPEQILAKISTKKQGRVLHWNFIKYAAAAVVAVGLSLTYFLYEPQNTTPQLSTIEQLSEDEITAYLLKNAGVELLAKAYKDVKSPAENIAGDHDSSDAMEQYLLEHADESELMEDDI